MKNQLKKIIRLLKAEKKDFGLIIEAYENLLQIIEELETQLFKIKQNSIQGSGRAFLDIDSDYLKPVLFEMSEAEKMERELLSCLAGLLSQPSKTDE